MWRISRLFCNFVRCKQIYLSRRKQDMAKYVMYQTNDLNENGKPIVYPRMMLEGKSTTEHMAEYISEASSFTTGEVKGVLEMMANFLAQEMANGRSVKLDGIGVFSPSLGLAKGKEEDEVDLTRRNARSVRVKGVNFRADAELIRKTESACTLERAQDRPDYSSVHLSAEERLAKAQAFLEGHPFMTVSDYCRLTGLGRSTACVELRRWKEQADSGITVTGLGSHRVYVKKES